MNLDHCAQRQAAISALSDYFHATSQSFSRPEAVSMLGGRAESLRCQVEAHAERLAVVAGLAGQGRATLTDVEGILADLQELGVYADNRLFSAVCRLYERIGARAA
ncbi:hypothetical protein [Hyphomicrobium sp. LHD-15]|uniref:hypothetical protein n=1 Tax=Hyphomicrobium sp. LHD-15 TaxID=3072142 RepID=UPI00280C7E0E|nr:hypothetical protein [Hyphomicrobium sp. LHD-15]MDQ8700809.1 hypothetical protein [Hyphomicrobium sp. LHD-15]